MVERLKELIVGGYYAKGRAVANHLLECGEQSVDYWILNATLYEIEGIEEAEYACISRGLQGDARNYELYYMLGNYYRRRNMNQAYLCYEQAEYYCTVEDDLDLIRAEKMHFWKVGNVRCIRCR